MNIHGKGNWKLEPFEGCLSFYTTTPPGWFHRLMQRLILGFKWTRE